MATDTAGCDIGHARLNRRLRQRSMRQCFLSGDAVNTFTPVSAGTDVAVGWRSAMGIISSKWLARTAKAVQKGSTEKLQTVGCSVEPAPV